MPLDGETIVHDELHGDIVFKNSDIDDAIILKTDGLPTYHLAHIVDDHLMGVTHLLRAEEWISSAPRHIQIWNALGWQPPLFFHVPDVLGKDKKKLSKRHGAPSWKELEQRGFLPEAVFNFLALLGWSYDDKTEFFSREELIQAFSLDRIGVSGGILDMEKLEWMNGVYIRNLSLEEFTQRCIPYMERPEIEGGLPDSISRPLHFDYTSRVLSLEQERLRTLGEAAHKSGTSPWTRSGSFVAACRVFDLGGRGPRRVSGRGPRAPIADRRMAGRRLRQYAPFLRKAP